MSPILKLERDDEDREFEFNLDYFMSLTTPQRYELMFRRSAEAMERMIRHGHIKPVELVKRAANRPQDREDLRALRAIKERQKRGARGQKGK